MISLPKYVCRNLKLQTLNLIMRLVDILNQKIYIPHNILLSKL